MLPELKEKIKDFLDEYFWAFVAAFAVVIGVGFWQFSLISKEKVDPKIEKNAFEIHLNNTALGVGEFIASKNGTTYYPKDCKAASRIKEENRLFFASAIDAEGAGFRRSVQCSN